MFYFPGEETQPEYLFFYYKSNSICPDEFDFGQMECTLTNLNLTTLPMQVRTTNVVTSDLKSVTQLFKKVT